MLNKNKTGLIVGLFLAAIHFVWAFFVAVVPGQLQNFIDWVFQLHSLQPIYIITAFNFVNSVFLIIVTFAFGYLYGYLFALLWNAIHKGRRHEAREHTRRRHRARHRRR